MKMFNLYFSHIENLNFFIKFFIELGLICLFIILIRIFFNKIITNKKYLSLCERFITYYVSLSYIFHISNMFLFVFISKEKKQLIVLESEKIIIYVLISYFLIKFIINLKETILLKLTKSKTNNDIYDVRYDIVIIIEKVLKSFVIIALVFKILHKLGIHLYTLFTLGGVSGIVIAFICKDLFINIISGITLYLDKPFLVGDWILSPDKNIEGNVSYIGWGRTKIITPDKYPIYVPNSFFNSVTIGNMSNIVARKIKEDICICNADFAKMKKIVEDVKNMLIDNFDINKKYTFSVNFEYRYGLAILMILFYTNILDTVLLQEIKQEILLKVEEIIKKNNANIMFIYNRQNKQNNTLIQDDMIESIYREMNLK